MGDPPELDDGEGEAIVWNSAYPPSINAGIPKLGDIPEGWSRLRLREMLDVIERPVKLRDDQVYRLVTAKRSRGGIVARSELRGDAIKVKQQFEVRVGDFILSNRQIAHGGCGIVPPELNGAIVSGEYTVLKPRAMLDLRYLHYLSHSAYFQQVCFHSGVGVHVEKLVFRPDDWLNAKFDVPPLPVQHRIVEILGEIDRTIATTDALVEAKQRCKRALMQRLLSLGATRSLTDVAKVEFSGVDKVSVVGERAVQLCNYTDVYKNNRIRHGMAFMEATATPNEIDRWELREGDVLFTKDSETADDIAATTFVPHDMPGVICGYHLGRARSKPGQILGEFLAYAMETPVVRNQFRRLANGVTRFGLNLDCFDQVELCVPDIATQRLVSGVLGSCDDEIESLNDQSSIFAQQKRGLMQRLLTGALAVSPAAPETVAA